MPPSLLVILQTVKDDYHQGVLHCLLYANTRQNMVTPLSNINNQNIHESILLFGSADNLKNDNLVIFQAVQMFIKYKNN